MTGVHVGGTAASNTTVEEASIIDLKKIGTVTADLMLVSYAMMTGSRNVTSLTEYVAWLMQPGCE